jgi:hypothetical protein
MDQGLVQVQNKRIRLLWRGLDVRHFRHIVFCFTFLVAIWFWHLVGAQFFIAIQMRVFWLVRVDHVLSRAVVGIHLDPKRSYNNVGGLLLRQIVENVVLSCAQEVVRLLGNGR